MEIDITLIKLLLQQASAEEAAELSRYPAYRVNFHILVLSNAGLFTKPALVTADANGYCTPSFKLTPFGRKILRYMSEKVAWKRTLKTARELGPLAEVSTFLNLICSSSGAGHRVFADAL